MRKRFLLVSCALLLGMGAWCIGQTRDLTLSVVVKAADVDNLVQLFGVRVEDAPTLLQGHVNDALEFLLGQHRRMAVEKAVEALKSDPGNKEKAEVLKSAVERLRKKEQ